jgi:hypothetical protein
LLRPPGLKRIRRHAFPLISTSAAEKGRSIFNAEPFVWEFGSQIVFLSAADAPPPAIQFDHVDRIFQAELLNRDRLDLPSNITGLLLPAVDGDFVEVVAFDEQLWQTLLRDLDSECTKMGVRWSVVSENEFKGTRWFQKPLSE